MKDMAEGLIKEQERAQKRAGRPETEMKGVGGGGTREIVLWR